MSKRGNWLFGIILIIIGVMLILKNMGFIEFSFWEIFRIYWPVLLILFGFSMVFRHRAVPFLLLIAFAAIIGSHLAGKMEFNSSKEIFQQVEDRNIKTAEVNVKYNAGRLSLGKGNTLYLLKNYAVTSDKEQPRISVERLGSHAEISVHRLASPALLRNDFKESWNLGLSPGVDYKISADYSASDAKIDLREIRVLRIEISSRASSTELIFGDYETQAIIDAGASSLTLKIPKDHGAKITIEGSLNSLEMEGFEKEGNAYANKNYNPAGKNIEIKIDAGASSVRALTY